MGNSWRKETGIWKKAIAIWHKVGGSWEPLKSAYQKVAGTFVNVFDSKVVVEVTANQTNLVLRDLFTSDDWYSGKAKTVWIKSGVVVSQGNSFNAALVSQSGSETTIWGGTLTVLNDGIIQGKGGPINSGQGGDALYSGTMSNTDKKVQIINNGIIRAGGGGGGRGGSGGGGYYYYTATEGPYYSRSGATYWFSDNNQNGQKFAFWASVQLSNADWSFTNGAYTYSAVTKQTSGSNPDYYSIQRAYTATAYTSGGTYGNGGRGQGSDGANTNGTAGSAGGTNAGTGGTGGAGGTWGNPGNTGFTGSSGNYSSGLAGAAGGQAGYAYKTSLYNILIPGTILGRVA